MARTDPIHGFCLQLLKQAKSQTAATASLPPFPNWISDKLEWHVLWNWKKVPPPLSALTLLPLVDSFAEEVALHVL